MVDNTFFQERVVLCQHREFADYPCRLPHDQSHKAQGDPKIEQIHRHMVGIGFGKYHLVEIQPVSEDQKYGHKSYRTPVAFGAPLHKDQQRAHKVDYQVQIKDASVRPIESGLEIDRLFGDIRIPDQHELRKP